MDHHAVLVLHRSDIAAAAERGAGRNGGEDAVDVLCRPEALHTSCGGVFGDADARERDAADAQRIALALEDQGTAAPAVADAGCYGTARKLDDPVGRLCGGYGGAG